MTVAHVMLNLETFGIRPDAMIASIGAVKFNPNAVGEINDRFYVLIDPETSSGSISMSTIRWWMVPDRSTAREQLLADGAVDMVNALDGFAAWLGGDSPPVWGNGAAFDNVVLASAYRRARIDRPWSHKQDRCYRTLRALAPGAPTPLNAGIAHNALDAALWQATSLQMIVEHLGIKV